MREHQIMRELPENERPYEKSQEEEHEWLLAMAEAAISTTGTIAVQTESPKPGISSLVKAFPVCMP